MMTISLCMIVRNEEAVLERCLRSACDIADEIVIVDTGSTDETKEIARRYTDRIYDFEWTDDFAAARNFSFDQATMDYILWLDADDYFLPEDRERLLRLKRQLDPAIDGVTMPYKVDFDEYGNCRLSIRRVRLVKRSRRYRWEGAVHEDLVLVDPHLVSCDIAVVHGKDGKRGDKSRNLNIYRRLAADGKEWSKRDVRHYALELRLHGLYDEAIRQYNRYLGFEGVTEGERIDIYMELAECHFHLGDHESELHYVLKTFLYDTPRSPACCRLGYYFLKTKRLHQAIFWYQLAAGLQKPADPWAADGEALRTWVPHAQLGQCYYELGQYELSHRHNTIALRYRPGDPTITSNLKLLERKMAQRQRHVSE
mgnify:CR=1 FL=1